MSKATPKKKRPRSLVSEAKLDEARETLKHYFGSEGDVSFQEASAAQETIDRYLREEPERARRATEARSAQKKKGPKLF
jgi:hypothetical protein